MALSVVFRPQAEDEALEVRQWYELRRAGLGREFGQALDVLVLRIASNPLVFPRVHSGSALLAYKINWQSVLFLGYGDDRELSAERRLERVDRQVFVKLSHAFQR